MPDNTQPLSPQGYNITITPVNHNPFWEDEPPQPVPDIHGVPSGGTTGQVLTKESDADYDANWEDPPGAVTFSADAEALSAGSLPTASATRTGDNINIHLGIPAGATGATGPQGPQGPQGERGATGATGATGPAGATGATGPQGPAGATGARGPAGTNGISPSLTVTDITGGHRVTIVDANGTRSFDVMDGEDGATGPQGPAGPTGPTGATGPAGADGADGTDGVSPTVAVTTITGGHQVTITDAQGTSTFDVMDGEDGATGATGPQGPQGPAGPQGPQGPAGPQGPQGPAGTGGGPLSYGTPITAATYPGGTFAGTALGSTGLYKYAIAGSAGFGPSGITVPLISGKTLLGVIVECRYNRTSSSYYADSGFLPLEEGGTVEQEVIFDFNLEIGRSIEPITVVVSLYPTGNVVDGVMNVGGYSMKIGTDASASVPSIVCTLTPIYM